MTEVTVKVLVWVTGWLIVADPLVMVVQETKYCQQWRPRYRLQFTH